MPDSPTLLLTRPAAQSRAFLSDVAAALGKEPPHIVSPVLRVEQVRFDDPGPVQALVFTSANGVGAFADQHDARGRRAFCVGDATRDAAQAAGFESHSADGDAAALIALIQAEADPDGGPLVHVSGESLARDVSAALVQAGFTARRIMGYRQLEEPLTDVACRALKNGPVVAPVFSPASAVSLARQVMPLPPFDLTMVAISQNAAIEGPWMSLVAGRPTRASMIDAVVPLL